MADKQQTVRVQNQRQAQPKAEPITTEKTREGAAITSVWFAGFTAAPGSGSVDERAAWLNNTDIQRAQRVKLASQIGRVHGNQHLQMLMASLKYEEHASYSHNGNGHSQPAPVSYNNSKHADNAAEGAELSRDPLADLFEFANAGGSSTMAGAEPPPNGRGNGAVIVHPGVQRQAAGETAAEDTPTEEEKAAALAKAKAAQAQATQTVGETKTEIAKSRNEADAEREAGQTKKEEAAAAKAAQPALAEVPEAIVPITEEAPTEAEPALVDAAAPEAAPGVYEQAPASPQEDPGFQAVTARIHGVATQARRHAPSRAKSAEAQAASEPPIGEVTAKAQAKQVSEMERAETSGFDAAAFKARLMQRVQELAPKTAEEADNFKKENKLGGLKNEAKGDVAAQQSAALEPTKVAAAQAPDTAGIEPKPVTPLQPAAPGAPPPSVGAEQAAIKPKSPAEVEAPLQEESKSLDTQMAEANVTDKQLAKSNEPEFQAALSAKKEAQANARQAPQEYRTNEPAQVAQAEAEAVGVAQERTQAMHGDRAALLGQIVGKQGETKGKDEGERARVASGIQKIYDKTKANVERILGELDAEVGRTFDAGAEAAKKGFEDYVEAKMTAFKEERYGGWFGWARWAKDKLVGMPDEVNAFYVDGRQLFVQKMDAVIDDVAMIVGKGLAEAKAEIANGKKEVQTYVAQLPVNLRRVGEQAAGEIQDKFSALDAQVTSNQDELIDSLAQKYQQKLQAVDARIDEMKAANHGLVAKAFDFIKNVVGTIAKLVAMLTRIMAKIAEVVGLIIEDPVGFLGNFIDGIKLGFNNFVANIGAHLQKGLIAWLTGAMEGVTIQMPEDVFSLPGIFSLVMQILGLTWDYIRSKAVKLLGEKTVKLLETAFTPFKILISEGPIGLWQWVKDQFNDLKDTVMAAIKDMIITEVIKAGIKWLLGLFNPIGAFIKACMAIYDIVMFFINNAERIGALIESIIDAAGAIAKGGISVGAKLIEGALAKMVPLVIGFLASLLNLGDLGKKVLGIVQKVHGRIDKMVNGLIARAKQVALRLISKRKEGTETSEKPDNDLLSKVKRDLLQAFSVPIREPKQTQTVISAIFDKYHAKGLRYLDVSEDPSTPGHFQVNASASPLRKVADIIPGLGLMVGDLLPISGGAGFGKTVLTAIMKVGDIEWDLGRYENTKDEDLHVVDRHAEKQMLFELEDDWRDLAKKNKPIHIIINLTRTPCADCSLVLKEFVKRKRREGYDVHLTIRAVTIYGGAETNAGGELQAKYEGTRIAVQDFKKPYLQIEPLDVFAVLEDKHMRIDPKAMTVEQQSELKRRIDQLKKYLEQMDSAKVGTK